jgi:hypothetical protein
MGEFFLALAFLGLIVAFEDCCQGRRRKTEATWD